MFSVNFVFHLFIYLFIFIFYFFLFQATVAHMTAKTKDSGYRDRHRQGQITICTRLSSPHVWSRNKINSLQNVLESFSVICMHANDAKAFLKHFSDCLFYFCSIHVRTLGAEIK